MSRGVVKGAGINWRASWRSVTHLDGVTEANIHFLLHSAALVEKAAYRALQPFGPGHSQAPVLDALDRMGLSSQIELAQELCITAASMSTMTVRLLASGYIDRRKDPDEKRSSTL